MKRLCLLLILVLLSLGGKPFPGLELTAESRTSTWLDQTYNLTCYHEDSVHLRRWTGMLPAGGVFEVQLEMCPWYIEGIPGFVGAGGAGIFLNSDSKGDLDLVVIAPSGRTYTPHLVESYPPRETETKCVISDLLSGPVDQSQLEPGVWTVRVENKTGKTVRDIWLNIDVQTAFRETQQIFCLPEDRNFIDG